MERQLLKRPAQSSVQGQRSPEHRAQSTEHRHAEWHQHRLSLRLRHKHRHKLKLKHQEPITDGGQRTAALGLVGQLPHAKINVGRPKESRPGRATTKLTRNQQATAVRGGGSRCPTNMSLTPHSQSCGYKGQQASEVVQQQPLMWLSV